MKSYVFEADSPEAVAIIEAAGNPVIYSHVHSLEIPNAIRLKRFRGEITEGEESAALRAFRADVDAGRLARPDYELAQVFIRAEQLSAKHAHKIGARSLDLLHVAAALESNCTDLASFDERQRTVAAHVGMKLIPARRKRL